MTADSGFYCDMTAMSPKQRGRYDALRAKLEASVVAVYELPNGYALQLRTGSFVVAELAAFVIYEKRCCPFLELMLDGSPDSPGLRITGRDGVKEFIRAEFSAIKFE